MEPAEIRALAEVQENSALPQIVLAIVFSEGATRNEIVDFLKQELKSSLVLEQIEHGQSGPRPKLRKLGAKRLRSLKEYYAIRGHRLTDEDLVEYQQICLGDYLKDQSKNRTETNFEEFVQKALPFKNPQDLGPAAREADELLSKLIRKPPGRR